MLLRKDTAKPCIFLTTIIPPFPLIPLLRQ
nr:MAG TPA: hypothetical protein [Caudoviricetes sp.]